LIRISISDMGDGIKEEDIPKLFQPFERLGADKTDAVGSGIGLLVVKKLIEALGGRVGVESELGVGSTFWVELPQAENGKSDIQINSGELIPELSTTKQAMTILYVEDNLVNIELIEEILTEHRPEIRLVTSIYGRKTIQLAKKHAPGLILLDLDLPDMHGFEVLEKLKAETHTKSIPVIIISADAMPHQIEKLIKAGAVDYMTKPLDVNQFLKLIDQHAKI